MQPTLTKDDSALEISCPGYDPNAAPPPAPELLDITIVNKCSQPVQVKVSPHPTPPPHPPWDTHTHPWVIDGSVPANVSCTARVRGPTSQ